MNTDLPEAGIQITPKEAAVAMVALRTFIDSVAAGRIQPDGEPAPDQLAAMQMTMEAEALAAEQLIDKLAAELQRVLPNAEGREDGAEPA